MHKRVLLFSAIFFILIAVQGRIFTIDVYGSNSPVFTEAFESGTNNLFDLSNGDIVSMSNFGIGSAFRTTSTSSTITAVSKTFTKTYLFDNSIVGADCYAETEFDLMTKNPTSVVRTLSLSLASSKPYTAIDGSVLNNTSFCTLSFKPGNNISLSNATYGTNLFSPIMADNRWYRIKIIMQITDANNNSIRKVCALYVDGINVLTQTPSQYPSFMSGDINKIPYYDEISIQQPDTAGIELYLDNFSVATYNGVSNSLVNKGALVSAIREADEKLHDKLGWSTSLEYNQLKSIRDSAAQLYSNSNISQMQVDDMTNSLMSSVNNFVIKYGSFEVQTLNLTNEQGQAVNSFANSGFVDSIVLTKNTSVALNGKLLVAEYDNKNKLISIDFKTIPSNETAGTVQISVNRKLPIDISGMHVKILVWEDIANSINPLMPCYDTEDNYKTSVAWDVYVGGKSYKMDVNPVLAYNGEVMVPASNILNILGMQFETYDGYYYAENDAGQSLKFSVGKRQAVINGVAKDMKTSAILYDNVLVMIPLTAIKDAFGASYIIDEVNKKIQITYTNVEPNYITTSMAAGNVITYKGGAKFRIPYSNPNAKVEVWAKLNINSMPSLQYMNAGTWNGVYKSYHDNSAILYWRKAYTLKYENGAFCGSFGDLYAKKYYDLRCKITDNGNETFYVVRNAFLTPSDLDYTTINNYAYHTGTTLLLVPTFENMSYYADESDSLSTCTVQYRKVGESTWGNAYTPYYDKNIGQFRGSIVNLSPNTSYEVSATITNSSGTRTVASTMSTWSENPTIQRTINIRDIYSGSGTLSLDGLQGTADGWIKVIGDGNTVVNAGRNSLEAVYISDCKYVIFENVKVQGGYRYGIHITGGSDNVRIENCDVSGWGRCGILNATYGQYLADGGIVNYDAGIRIFDTSNIVVERCYLHDSNAKTNSWNSSQWSNVHPNGSEGILYFAKNGLVLRYNDIIGSDDHRWNDGMEGLYNMEYESGPGRDSDIYGNMVAFGQDDGMEIDSGGMNVRIYKNRFEQSLCGISAAPVRVGPAYIFRNLVTNLGDVNGSTNTAIKEGIISYNTGLQYIFNNTIDANSQGIYGGGSEYHTLTRNNILVSRMDPTKNYAIWNTYVNTYPALANDSNDYDLLRGLFIAKPGDELHSISGEPNYNNVQKGDYSLADGSLGIDAGQHLNNFSDDETIGSLPDMGAFEHGGSLKFLPYIPVDIWADKYIVKMTSGEQQDVTINIGNIEAGRSYSIVKNNDFSWMSISTANNSTVGNLSSNSTVTFTIKADVSKLPYDTGKGVVLFRLDNGYSIPITILCNK